VAKNGQSLFWAGMNKGKRSIAVDMKSPRGKELVTEIITAPGDDAGLFLTNLRVRGWMDHETLSRHRSDLIMVTLSGDRHGRPAVDYTVNPSLGFPDATGPAGSTDPVAHVLPAWDCIAGNLAVTSLLAAERHRLRTGEGQDVDLSLKDVAAAMMGHLGIIAEVKINGVNRPKGGNALYGAYGQDFICKDGRRVMVIGLTDRQWRGIVKVTGAAEAMAGIEAATGLSLADEGARWEARFAITEALKPWFAAHTMAQIAPLFDEVGLTWSEFRDFERAVTEDPDLSTDNPMFQTRYQPGIGSYPMPASPVTFSAAQTPEAAPAPVLGAHTEEILADVVGLPDHEIGALFDTGVVTGPSDRRAALRA
jgi:2-methylfumaryl-CoA isomerase